MASGLKHICNKFCCIVEFIILLLQVTKLLGMCTNYPKVVLLILSGLVKFIVGFSFGIGLFLCAMCSMAFAWHISATSVENKNAF